MKGIRKDCRNSVEVLRSLHRQIGLNLARNMAYFTETNSSVSVIFISGKSQTKEKQLPASFSVS